MLNTSQLINGRYHVLGQIAQGDLGPVYQAKDTETGAVCVLKPLTLAQEPQANDLSQEAEKVHALGHPNIVPPGALKVTEDLEPFLVREFIDGRTLEELIRKEAPLPLARSCSLARQIAMALEAAHHAGLIHGDLKPSNVLLVNHNGEESARVLGFGTLVLKKDRFINLARLTVENDGHAMFGAPEYISPEQAMGTQPEALDGRSDLYSLGVILYQMLTGELPSQGGSVMETLLTQIFTEPRPLSGRTDLEVPLAVDTLLMRTLAKKRAERPASATAVIDQLGPWEERRASPERTVVTQPAPVASSTPEVVIAKAPLPKLGAPSRASMTPPEPSPPVQEPVFEKRPLPREHRGDVAPPPPDIFVPDLAHAAKAGPAAGPPVSLDIPLNASRPTAGPAPAASPTASGSVLFASFHPRKRSKGARTVVKFFAFAALMMVIFAGAGYGWLYFTGRTYWLDRDFIKTRISYYLTSGTADTAPQTETVDQAPPLSPPTPITSSHATEATPKSPPAANGAAPVAAVPAPHRPAPASHPKPETKAFSATQPPLAQASQNTVAESTAVQDAIARGEYYFDRGDYDAAIEVYEKGLVQFPSNPKLIAGIARARRAKAAEAKYLQ